MGLFHVATVAPSKLEMVAGWIPTQPWGPSTDAVVEMIGAFRFDDPLGQVGMETLLVRAEGATFQVPLTYRSEPLVGADDASIAETEHSVLGTRWVYNGLRDPLFVTMLAAVAMKGQGEALGMVERDGRWHIAPTNVRLSGGGWSIERVPVDGFDVFEDHSERVVLRNDRFSMTAFRRPVTAPSPSIGLTATWPEQLEPILLAEVSEVVLGGPW